MTAPASRTIPPRTGNRVKVFLVPHTHWDREWYETAARFRQRLVRVLDEVLDTLARDQLFTCFLLDGQAAMVEDYLAVRPEQRGTIEALGRTGRLLVGPWYVLSDELLSSDECLVRNLLAGVRVGDSFGGALRLGYSPDTFGHPAALPTIFAGFGIKYAIVWRGYGGEAGQEKDLFRWIGPDGSELTVHHLPPAGYEVGAGIPLDPDLLVARWQALDALLAPRALFPFRLIPVGADHHAVDPQFSKVVAALRQSVAGHDFRIASPLDYFAALPPDAGNLPVSRGELRFSYRYTWTLQGIHSTRSRLKSAIAEGDRLLIRWSEPQAALARYERAIEARPLLRAAWREHLLNHPHDSLGGCVADEVARDIATRAASVTVQARGLLIDALHDRLDQDRSVARRGKGRWTPSLVVVNPRASAVNGIVESTITVFQDDVIVGGPDRRERSHSTIRMPSVIGPTGEPVFSQVLGEYDGYERLDSLRDYPDQDRVRAFRVALRVEDVPAFGLTALRVNAGGNNSVVAEIKDSVAASETALIARKGRVRGDARIGFALSAGVELEGLAQLESELDQGDTYTFQPVEHDRPLRGWWSPSRLVWPGPLVAAIQREVSLGERARATVSARMDAGSALIRFAVDGFNLTGNHRIRIRFPIPGDAAEALADMQYGPVTRPRLSYDRRNFPREWPVPTAPMHRYVSVGNSRRGLTLFARDSFEYELTGDGAIAITLLRAVGDFSREDLPARPGNAGWPLPTPEAQELGSFRHEFAVLPFGVSESSSASDWGLVERAAEEFHAPLAGLMLRYGIEVPPSIAGPELHGPGLAFKALKPSEVGTGVILRCVNVTNKPVEGFWRWPQPVTRARRVRLDETPLGEIRLEAGGRETRFRAEPREVVTILVE